MTSLLLASREGHDEVVRQLLADRTAEEAMKLLEAKTYQLDAAAWRGAWRRSSCCLST